METKLSNLRPGDRAKVREIPEQCQLKGRLREFGLVGGSDLRCLFLSPGKDLVALEVRGAVIALRTCDLADITVRRC